MGEALLTGSALAAFLAGVVAFFAPCCATVMLPSYLASAAGAERKHLAPLTATYVAGVATVVWPLTIGAAGLASVINQNHELLFIGGGVLMIVIAVATLGGWMFSTRMPQGRHGTDAGGVYLMGVFAGAATACCAPVLAGAVVIAGIAADWWIGALLGLFYLLGLITPLLAASYGAARARVTLRDPKVTLRAFGRALETTRMRIIGAATFFVLGGFAIVLGLIGKADTAPPIQEEVGRWLQTGASWLAENVPSLVGWAVMLALVAWLARLAWRALHPATTQPTQGA